tara:strand:+ start:821 stop:1003 length:183 start_codon:yes stop_codon:yes gene_type:complete
MTSNQQIEWEVQQLWMAIDYYERARADTHSRKEANKFEDTIKKLNSKIKKLERRKYESQV